MILVTGATGNVGREVVVALAKRAQPVRALVRHAVEAGFPDEVEVVAGDLTDPPSTRQALKGVDGVFLLPGYPGMAEAARTAGVQRIVQLSGGSAGSGDMSNAVTRYMSASETEVRATGLQWTFVRPNAYMSNALGWVSQSRRGNTIRLPFADVPIACVDPADVAAVAATALVEDGHHGMIHRLTGPQALRPAEQVATLADVLDRPLRFEAQSNGEARRAMLATTPAEYVGAFFDFYVNGAIDETTVRPTVCDVTGREPTTFRAWVTRHAARFTAPGPPARRGPADDAEQE